MTSFIAALPMYDWPELRGETDARWAAIRDALRAQGIDAPEETVRRNADMPAVPGGIRDAQGRVVAPDPAALPPDELDLAVLWRHPALLVCETCWGPMELGLSVHVRVVGQSAYDDVEGGAGAYYSSAIVMRRNSAREEVAAREDGAPKIPLQCLHGRRFAFNSTESMSGYLGIKRDLEAAGAGLSAFSGMEETGAHRASIRAVAEGRADVAAIDCRSWALAKRFEPATQALAVVGWTGRRKGLPFVQAAGLPDALGQIVENALRKAIPSA